jgi:hypothetical protein
MREGDRGGAILTRSPRYLPIIATGGLSDGEFYHAGLRNDKQQGRIEGREENHERTTR